MRTPIRIDIIAQFIRVNKMTDASFCKFCGIEKSDFDKMRNGDFSFPFETLYKIVDAMEINMIELFWLLPIPTSYV